MSGSDPSTPLSTPSLRETTRDLLDYTSGDSRASTPSPREVSSLLGLSETIPEDKPQPTADQAVAMDITVQAPSLPGPSGMVSEQNQGLLTLSTLASGLPRIPRIKPGTLDISELGPMTQKALIRLVSDIKARKQPAHPQPVVVSKANFLGLVEESKKMYHEAHDLLHTYIVLDSNYRVKKGTGRRYAKKAAKAAAAGASNSATTATAAEVKTVVEVEGAGASNSAKTAPKAKTPKAVKATKAGANKSAKTAAVAKTAEVVPAATSTGTQKSNQGKPGNDFRDSGENPNPDLLPGEGIYPPEYEFLKKSETRKIQALIDLEVITHRLNTMDDPRTFDLREAKRLLLLHKKGEPLPLFNDRPYRLIAREIFLELGSQVLVTVDEIFDYYSRYIIQYKTGQASYETRIYNRQKQFKRLVVNAVPSVLATPSAVPQAAASEVEPVLTIEDRLKALDAKVERMGRELAKAKKLDLKRRREPTPGPSSSNPPPAPNAPEKKKKKKKPKKSKTN